MEHMPAEWDNTFDVVISNGAFCLAPNKEASFREIFRVLRPGGRTAICTSTIKMPLKAEIDWPLCMRMFAHLDELGPMCTRVGFVDVAVDDSDSLMQFEIDASGEEPTPQRNKVHIASPEFEHLNDVDMNELCARVVVIANKPML